MTVNEVMEKLKEKYDFDDNQMKEIRLGSEREVLTYQSTLNLSSNTGK